MTIQENPLFKEAIEFATFAHRTQKRKYTGEPYIQHPLKVAQCVADTYNDPDMVIAAALHDVVEDAFVSLDAIREKFGQLVCLYVLGLTSPSKQHPELKRDERKKMDRNWLIMQPWQTVAIKLRDMQDNLHDLATQDPKFAKKYADEKLLDVLSIMDSRIIPMDDESLRAACEEIAKILDFPANWIYRRPFRVGPDLVMP